MKSLALSSCIAVIGIALLPVTAMANPPVASASPAPKAQSMPQPNAHVTPPAAPKVVAPLFTHPPRGATPDHGPNPADHGR